MVNTKKVVAPSQNDWKIVDRDVKEKNKPNKFLSHIEQLDVLFSVETRYCVSYSR